MRLSALWQILFYVRDTPNAGTVSMHKACLSILERPYKCPYVYHKSNVLFLLYNAAAASTAPAVLNNFGFVIETSSPGYFHSMNLAQPRIVTCQPLSMRQAVFQCSPKPGNVLVEATHSNMHIFCL
jgi:hypothetical protein